MKWLGRRSSANVEDRRGSNGRGIGSLTGGRGCGCGSIVTFLIVIAIYLFTGVNVLDFINPTRLENTTANTEYVSSKNEDDMAQFVKVVLADTEDVWINIFNRMGKNYRKPVLVLYNKQTYSGCGTAQQSTGPFYCPADEKIYVDLSFFQEMATQFKAGGDFAYAYVIAHEIGHHVQKLLGTLDKSHGQMSQANKKTANQISVCTELQADFYAGIWAYYTESMFHSLEDGDIDEALNAANAVGDDRLQIQAQGYAVPDSFTHGTSKQRRDWFYKGYQTGDIRQGDTFTYYLR
jgi:predicted metalloprotease